MSFPLTATYLLHKAYTKQAESISNVTSSSETFWAPKILTFALNMKDVILFSFESYLTLHYIPVF